MGCPPRRPHSAVLLSSLLWPLAAGCVADRPAPPPPRPFVVAAGDVDLADLVDRAAVYLGCNIVYRRTDLLAASMLLNARLQTELVTDRNGCEELVASLLQSAEFALTQSDAAGALREVIPLRGPRAGEALTRAVVRTPAEVLARPALRVPVRTVVELKHMPAETALAMLRPLLADAAAPAATGAGLKANVVEGSCVLSGMQDQVAQALQLLATSDAPPRGPRAAPDERAAAAAPPAVGAAAPAAPPGFRAGPGAQVRDGLLSTIEHEATGIALDLHTTDGDPAFYFGKQLVTEGQFDAADGSTAPKVRVGGDTLRTWFSGRGSGLRLPTLAQRRAIAARVAVEGAKEWLRPARWNATQWPVFEPATAGDTTLGRSGNSLVGFRVVFVPAPQ